MFDREKTRRYYLKRYASCYFNLDERQIEMLLTRSELLSKNDRFQTELESLDRSDEEKAAAFSKRWHVDFNRHWKIEFDDCISLPQPCVSFQGGRYSKFSITVEINLQYPKKYIMEQLAKMIDDEKQYLDDAMPAALHEWEWPPLHASGKVNTDLDDLRRYLEVYRHREAGKTWACIQKEMKLQTIQTGRNWHKRAVELINSGIPKLPAFPTGPEYDRQNYGPGWGVDGNLCDPKDSPWINERHLLDL